MEGLASELRVTPVGRDCDRHPADRVLRRLSSRRNVVRCVMMIVIHVLPTFSFLVSA
jgi:hypothetical protein